MRLRLVSLVTFLSSRFQTAKDPRAARSLDDDARAKTISVANTLALGLERAHKNQPHGGAERELNVPRLARFSTKGCSKASACEAPGPLLPTSLARNPVRRPARARRALTTCSRPLLRRRRRARETSLQKKNADPRRAPARRPARPSYTSKSAERRDRPSKSAARRAPGGHFCGLRARRTTNGPELRGAEARSTEARSADAIATPSADALPAATPIL